jgi:hypothetical protein
MSDRSSNVGKWIGVAVVVTLVALAAIVAPRLYRAGRSVVAPVVEMSRLEDRLTALDETFPPSTVSSDALEPERLEAFLDIRDELQPRYERWDEVVREVESEGDSWTGARDVLAASRDVLRTQIEALEARSMSPTEFRALERLVYDEWLGRLDDRSETVEGETLAEVTRSDLEFVRERSLREPPAVVLTDLEVRLESRLARIESSGPPDIEGVSPAVAALLWSHRDRIASLRLAGNPMHSALRSSGAGAIHVRVGDADRPPASSEDPDPEDTGR